MRVRAEGHADIRVSEPFLDHDAATMLAASRTVRASTAMLGPSVVISQYSSIEWPRSVVQKPRQTDGMPKLIGMLASVLLVSNDGSIPYHRSASAAHCTIGSDSASRPAGRSPTTSIATVSPSPAAVS